MYTRQILSVVAAVAILVVFIASGVQAQPPAQELLVAVLAPLSGVQATWGVPIMRGAETYVKDINKAGGIKVGGKIYTLKVRGYDHKYDVNEAVSAARKALNDGAVMISELGGGVLAAQQTISEPAGIITIACAAGGCRIINPQNPLTFLTFAGFMAVAERMPDEMFPIFKTKRVAMLQPDDDIGRETAEIFKKYLARAYPKVELVGEEYVPRVTTDFYPVLGRIIKRKPDTLFSVNLSEVGLALVAKQSRELGYTGPIMGATDCKLASMIKVAGAKNLDLVTVRYFVKPPTPLFEELNKRHLAEYGEEASCMFQDGYEDVRLWVRGVQKAGTFDSKVVAETIANSVYPDYVKGPGKWADYGCGLKRNFDYPMEMAIFEGGKLYDWFEWKAMKSR